MTTRAIAIDGNALAYRLYYASIKQIDYYVSHQLVVTNALRLFIITVNNLLKKQKYDYGIIAFDTNSKLERAIFFERYKANRARMPSYLVEQMNLIKIAASFFGFQTREIAAVEADDLVGSFAVLCEQNLYHVDCFSSDYDFLQLVNQFVSVFLFKKGISEMVNYNYENFTQKFWGLKPYQVTDYKALVGDQSDNYTGIRGIGTKTAVKLLMEYDNVENIISNLDNLPTNWSQKIRGKEKLITDFLWLSTIKKDVLKEPISNFKLRPIEHQNLFNMAQKYQMNSVMKLFIK